MVKYICPMHLFDTKDANLNNVMITNQNLPIKKLQPKYQLKTFKPVQYRQKFSIPF